jgi:predicted permease
MLRTSDGESEIVGVARPGLTLPLPGPFSTGRAMSGEALDLWFPMKLDRAGPHYNSHPNVGIGRLAPGRTVREAQAEITRLTRQFPEVVPNAYPEAFMREYNFRGEAAPLRDAVLGPSLPRTMWMLFGAVMIVLLIAAANVAGLFIVRHEARRRESAVRVALGADRRHMAVHYLAESLALCVAAAVLGVWLSFAGLRALLAIAPSDIPRLATVGMGWGTVVFAAVAAVGCALLFALPALRHAPECDSLREGGRTQTASRGSQSARDVMLIGQLALAVVLMAAAGLMIRSLTELRNVKPGFDHENVLAFDVGLPISEYDTREEALTFHRQLQEQIAALPGVEQVGSITSIPLEGFGTGCTVVWREGLPYPPGGEPPCVSTPIAGPGFFESLRMTVRGRIPTWTDVDGLTQAVVVTQALADRLWPGMDPIGQGINSNGSASTTWYKVVGVVPELRGEALDQPPSEAVFYPVTSFRPNVRSDAVNYLTYLVRTTGQDPGSLIAPTRRLLSAMNPRVPYVNARTMDQVFRQSTSRTSFVMLLLGIAAAVALLLSAVGTYGVVSYIVTQRKPEIGVRIALGASVREVSALVLLQSLRRAALGAVIGLAGAWATTRLLSRLLYSVSPTDPVVLVSVAVGLVGVAVLAAFAPARRAARVDPVEVLRRG